MMGKQNGLGGGVKTAGHIDMDHVNNSRIARNQI
jgi:hypothetical protein